MTSQEKLALSGGVISKPLFDVAFDLSGADKPRVLVDLNPSTTEAAFCRNQTGLNAFFKKNGITSYDWLRPSFEEIPGATEAADKIEAADILCVLGGSTRRLYQKWHELGVAGRISERVAEGSLVGCGGSAGAMIWFAAGYSDSNQYEVGEGEKWEYVLVPGMETLPAWVTAHHGDTDAFGRLRSVGFQNSLRNHAGEWKWAVGLDSAAALVCTGGLARAVYLREPSKSATDTAHIYISNNGPQAWPLRHNELIDLRVFK